MPLSEFYTCDDAGWDKFVSTGNVYDYLEYKSKANGSKNDNEEIILQRIRGGFCENRGKRDSNKRN